MKTTPAPNQFDNIPCSSWRWPAAIGPVRVKTCKLQLWWSGSIICCL